MTNDKKCEMCGKVSKYYWGMNSGHTWCGNCYKKQKTLQENIQEKEIINDNTQKILNRKQTTDMKCFVPNTNGYISRRICNTTDVKILEKAYNKKDFVLIVGETGTGKTHLIRHFCYKKKLPYARVNLNGGTTADELIGHFVPDETKSNGAIKWQDGILTTFVRNGGVIVLDEVNGCPADILFCLHPITDDERTLTLTDKDGEVVKAHPNFFLVATMNPDYEGTKPLNEAFKDRFKVKLNFDYNKKVEKQLIDNENILHLADKLRIMKTKGEITTPISTRMLIYYVDNIKTYSNQIALEIFLNNFEQCEREPIKNVIELITKGEDLTENEE